MFKNIKYDLKSGIVVFLVALPLCLGIALAQDVNLISGLLAGIIGGTVVSLMSGSKFSVSGPAAGLTSIVIAALSDLQTFEAFLMALVLAGIFQIIFGVLKAGVISHYFPSSVITGMLAGIGLFLVIKQIPHIVGYDKNPEGDFAFFQKDGFNSFSELGNMMNFVIPGALIIGVVSLLILILWETKWIKNNKILSNIPGALLVVIVGILLNEFLQGSFSSIAAYNDHLVSMPKLNSLADFDNAFVSPDWGVIGEFKVWRVAFTIALVASLESLLSLEAVDKLDPSSYISPPNRELIAQGSGNVISGLIGGIPITSVIVRSSANINAGARSKASSFIHGIFLLLAVLFLAPFLEMIPYAALGAVLLMVGYKLAKPSLFIKSFKSGMNNFLPFIVTLVVMLLTDLLIGVLVGIAVGIIFILIRNYKHPFNMNTDTINGKMHYVMQLSENVTFINKGKIVETLRKIPNNSKVYIDGKKTISIDNDVLESITIFKQSSEEKNIEVILENIKEVELSTH